MIWGRVAWNAWFQFEPRLVTFLLLWLLFLSYVLMRAYGDRQKIASQSAVLGILCSITAPVMWYSIKLLPQVAQMHPQVVARGGLDPEFRLAFFFSMATMVVLACYLMVLRSRLGLLEQRIQEIGSGPKGGQ
jgi:heme exporter protein C